MWDDKLLRSGNRLLLWLYDEFRNIKKNECTRLSLFKTFNPATITTDSKPERLQKISQNRIFSFGLPVFKIHVKIFSLPFSSMLWCILADALLHILTELTFNVFPFIYIQFKQTQLLCTGTAVQTPDNNEFLSTSHRVSQSSPFPWFNIRLRAEPLRVMIRSDDAKTQHACDVMRWWYASH